MPFSIRDLLFGIILPAAIALTGTLLAARLFRRKAFVSSGSTLSLIAGFAAGYWLLDLGPVRPEYDWHWTPYAVVLVLIPASLPGTTRGLLVLKCVLLAITIGLSAWLLVPTFESLNPSRTVHILVWSIDTFLLSTGMLLIARAEPFPDSPSAHVTEEPSRTLATGSLLRLSLMIATLAAAAGLLVLSGNLSFGQIAAAGMAALIGFAVAGWFSSRRLPLEGVSLVYSVLISAMMLTGKVNSSSGIPTACYLLLPLTPLAYALALPGRSEKLSWNRVLSVLGVAIVISGLAIGMALSATLGGESEY